MENFLLINKPAGWTSFDVVGYLRKQLSSPPFQGGVRGGLPSIAVNTSATPSSSLPLGKGERTIANKQNRLRVGHAGTLDPFATGLLIVGVGREATKKLDEFKNMPKTYVATIKLGATSDTYDKTGHITIHDARNMTQPTAKQIKDTIKSFTGKQMQIPPMFSAKKINGKRLYELARKGIEVERQANAIEIYKIKILDYSWPFLKIEVQCSAGTYIRSLAHDIGAKLKTGAYCDELVRTKIGKYSLKKATDINDLKF